MSKKILVLMFAVVLAVTGCNGGEAATQETTRANATETTATQAEAQMPFSEYKELVAKCNDDIYELSVILGNMGRYQSSYWENLSKLGGTIKYDNLVTGAYEWLEKNSDYTQARVEEEYQNIKTQYSEISAINVTDNIALDARSSLKDMFENFNALYTLVTSPSGGYNNFVDNYNEYIRNVKNLNSSLSTIIS